MCLLTMGCASSERKHELDDEEQEKIDAENESENDLSYVVR